ncbi:MULTISPECIES: SsgA family sporulation/cell division regulator [Streptomyces]|uniref:SsgA family sporulation/cell division regulator n=1 Tax=Streptomyces TaxID=1883 RepID=UPI0036BD8EF1
MNDPRKPSVAHRTTVHVSVPGGMPAPLPAVLLYDPDDPYAVRLSFGAPATDPVDWVFARSLLIEGLRRPVGIGDVLVIPRHGRHPGSMRIVLRSPAGAALIDVAESPVTAFLRRSVSLVPPGTESFHIDLDRTLDALTGRWD